MKKIILSLFLPVLLPGFVACSDDSPEPDASGVELTAFEAAVSASNTLRAEVQTGFSAPTTYCIEYWESGDETTERITESYQSAEHASATLILLKPQTQYTCRIRYDRDKVSSTKTFTTLAAPMAVPHHDLYIDNMTEELPGYLLGYNRNTPGSIYLMDTRGTLLWYEMVDEGVLVANFDARNNRLYMLTGPTSQEYAYNGQFVKVIDLFGNTILSKDLTTVPELSDRQIHHECRPLPDGSIIMVSYVDRDFDLTAQGGSAHETVKGDGYVIMNLQGEVTKLWDCFDTLNPVDDPTIMSNLTDWLHGNSINYDSQGNYYMTFNTISQLWKIDPETDEVKYRVGRGGTVSIPDEGLASGMHCANPQTPDEVLVIDNARSEDDGSRAIMYKVDEAQQSAEVTLDCELPNEYSSPNRSDVQKIGDNLLLFGSGTARLILFTDTQPQVNILRAISTPQIFYRVEYIPTITY